jgi:hypothetical protein
MRISRCVVTQRKTTFIQFWIIYPGLGITGLSSYGDVTIALETRIIKIFHQIVNVIYRASCETGKTVPKVATIHHKITRSPNVFCTPAEWRVELEAL